MKDEFADYAVGIFSIETIQTLQTTPDDAKRITDSLPYVSEEMWQEFENGNK